MAEGKDAKVEADVEVYNQGDTTHQTSKGPLRPNHALILPALEAKRMCAYSYIVTADKILKSAGVSAGNELLKKENDQLKAQIKKLEGEVGSLQGKVEDFLNVSKMAELKELQEKHAPEGK